MSVNYRGLLILGYEWDTVQEILPGANYQGAFEDEHWDDMDTQEKLEYLNLNGHACCYDGGRDESIFGWKVARSGTYDYREVSASDIEGIQSMSVAMTATYGVVPKLYIMAEGS